MVLYSGDWIADANCKVEGEPWNERFIEAIGVEMGMARQSECRSLCLACPVYTQCHRWVFGTKPDPSAHMFAAGMTYRQRRRWRHLGRPMDLPPDCGTLARYDLIGCRCAKCKDAHDRRQNGEQQQVERERR